MAFLFDTDAISELLRPRPAAKYVKWLMEIPREEQFTSSIVIGELYKGAYRSQACEHHLSNIENVFSLRSLFFLLTFAPLKSLVNPSAP